MVTTNANAANHNRTDEMGGSSRRSYPVKLWAVVGALFLVLEVYVLVSWIASGDAQPTPKGPTPLPGWMTLVVHGEEVLSVLAAVAFVYYFLVRPWRRQGHITTEGLLCVVFLTLYWQDPIADYARTWFTYNAEFVNLGNWGAHIPGWHSADGKLLAEPLIYASASYLYAVLGTVLLGKKLMGRVSAHWPKLKAAHLVILVYIFFVITDFLMEGMFGRLGLTTFPGSIRSLTLFAGHYYQFPVYEAVVWPLAWTAFASLVYFRNDRGETFAERGASQLPLTQRSGTGLRFLALTGACNVLMLVMFCLPTIAHSVHGDPWPEDHYKRSYFTDGYCGPGVSRPCP